MNRFRKWIISALALVAVLLIGYFAVLRPRQPSIVVANYLYQQPRAVILQCDRSLADPLAPAGIDYFCSDDPLVARRVVSALDDMRPADYVANKVNCIWIRFAGRPEFRLVAHFGIPEEDFYGSGARQIRWLLQHTKPRSQAFFYALPGQAGVSPLATSDRQGVLALITHVRPTVRTSMITLSMDGHQFFRRQRVLGI